MIRIYLILFFAFKSLFINALDKDSCRNNIFLNSNLVFNVSLSPGNLNLKKLNNIKDSTIRNTIGVNHSIFLNSRSSGIGLGLGLEFLTIGTKNVPTVPVFLSTRIGKTDAHYDFVLKAGTFLTTYNFKKIYFYDIGFKTKPFVKDVVFFGLNYRRIQYQYENNRAFIFDNIIFSIGAVID